MNSQKRFSSARSALLEWYKCHGRHSLPWRREINAYYVLVSEFMLQQTTVSAVLPRFSKWMRSFHTLSTLASATEEEVLTAWQGLGYYSRARRLHSAAKVIIERHGGDIPRDENALLSLPGIGSYTAAAIRAFAYDEHALVLDTNIIRVLARWADTHIRVDTASGRKRIEEIASAFYPRGGCREIASALMDLGATLCTTGKPECSLCPLNQTCRTKEPDQLPRKTPRTVTLSLNETRVWFYQNERLYLEQSKGPRWYNLWILPELRTGKARGRPLAEFSYPITRYRITMQIYRTIDKPSAIVRGFTREELHSIPIPSPHRRAIAKVCKAIGMVEFPDHT